MIPGEKRTHKVPIIGALAGWVAGVVVGAVDAVLVLRGTGAFWMDTRRLLEPVLVYALCAAVFGVIVVLPVALLTRRVRADRLFRMVSALFLFAGLSVVGTIHLWDVGLSVERRGEIRPYVDLLVAASVAAAFLWLATRSLRSPAAMVATTAGLSLGAVLVLSAIRLLAAADEFPDGSSVPADGAWDIVVLVMDTTRRDALSIYGNPRPTSPSLERLAHEGVVFSSAYAPSAWTPPSHASLFTGTYPSTHGTSGYVTGLGDQLPTLARELSALGYHTGSVGQKDLLSRRTGWARGFHTSVVAGIEDRLSVVYRRALSYRERGETETPAMVDLTLRWMKEARTHDRPFFVFLNLNDPHTPYEPREPYLSRYLDAGVRTRAEASRVQPVCTGRGRTVLEDLGEEDLQVIRAIYDSEVAYMDEAIGRLVDWIQASPRERALLLLVTSDHGEFLGEHDSLYHAGYPYQEMIHIPFLLWSDPPLARGERSDLVSQVDVFPTVIRLAGGDRDSYPHLAGRDFLADPPPAVVFSEHWKDSATESPGDRPPIFRKAAINASTKLIWDYFGEERIYRLDLDPQESTDRSEEMTDELEMLTDELRQRFPLTPASDAFDLDDASRRRLEALGYLN